MKFFRKHKVMALILTAVIVFCFVSDTPYFCDTKNVSADTKRQAKMIWKMGYIQFREN